MDRVIKTTYTAREIEELKDLIRQRVKAVGKSAQKRIRDKMRDLGFYGSDFGIYDCQIYHLEGLIQSGVIKVIGTPAPAKHEAVPENTRIASNGPANSSSVEDALINDQFFGVKELSREDIPDIPGLYCIKLREGIAPLPTKYGKIREDGIIYIGKASASLRKRLWDQELNHKSAATFFRSMGAILGYLPPKGSLFGKETRNYKFSEQDTDAIRLWMRESLLVNIIALSSNQQDRVEEALIAKYRPLVNIEHNPSASEELKAARQRCVDYAKSK